MVKIIRIIGVAMFLLTVSSAVWARVDEPPTRKPSTPTVTVPRTSPSPKGANYYHDDYYARHPSAPTATATPTIAKSVYCGNSFGSLGPRPTNPQIGVPICLLPKIPSWAVSEPIQATLTSQLFTGSAASYFTLTINQTPAPTPTTQAPVNNSGRHIPK